ncbi:MAG: DUF1232 domain-containing protein [Spirochaetaceae bacterium]|nr:DUF1232 domain-containing protein [Spirochaetaceae bacterium]
MAEDKLLDKFKTRAKKLMRNLSVLCLAYKRKDVSILAKIIILTAIGYALSPIDLIPDFVPILGYVDDLIILPFLICISLKLIPSKIMEECKERSKDIWKDGKPKKWHYAIPIIIIYLLIIFIIVKNIFFNS